MAKQLIVSVNGREKKIAIIEDDRVTEFYIERGEQHQGIVGNIYKGRVMMVLPGMQSAFVDIGLERDAFLYVSDFLDLLDDESLELKDETGAERVGEPDAPRSTGTVVVAPQAPVAEAREAAPREAPVAPVARAAAPPPPPRVAEVMPEIEAIEVDPVVAGEEDSREAAGADEDS